ncbi:hypothetical protein Z951_15255 [Streptomyces sp. PRh5]|uniref:hypothetical protein n=1 Tax=Streptomyces sp. PRh5 TaxID=1158056 RepID=UPI00044B1027|nr:hypothetical protein [Streptomyces sp. PRh5]EXU67313.1 hypothetical protein Z951_15255 [Streptomyces sp. PRh5]
MSALRTGVIGTGIAVHHAAALQAIPGVDLVGVDDIEPDRAVAFGAWFAIPRHAPDPESFLASGPDAVTLPVAPRSAVATIRVIEPVLASAGPEGAS